MLPLGLIYILTFVDLVDSLIECSENSTIYKFLVFFLDSFVLIIVLNIGRYIGIPVDISFFLQRNDMICVFLSCNVFDQYRPIYRSRGDILVGIWYVKYQLV